MFKRVAYSLALALLFGAIVSAIIGLWRYDDGQRSGDPVETPAPAPTAVLADSGGIIDDPRPVVEIVPPPPPARPLGDGLDVGTTFRDDFDAFDPAMWAVTDRAPSADWINCAWNPANVSAEGGRLVFRFTDDVHRGTPYSCAEVQRRGRFGYGTYEARMRTNAGSGLNAAFFTYIGPTHGKPHDEIDIELLGLKPKSASPNIFVRGRSPKLEPVDVNSSIRDFHTYGFHWTPEVIRFFVNGEEITTVGGDQALPRHAQIMHLSLWSSDTLKGWMGNFVPPDNSTTFEVDWVAFTRLDEGCSFADSLACRFHGESGARKGR